MPVTESGCWLWTGALTVRGYGKIGRDGKHLKAHRVSWLLYRGPIEAGHGVFHQCDVTCCVRPDHLFSGPQAINVADMYSKGRSYDRRGISNPRARFTLEQVAAIRADQRHQYIAAKDYGCSQSTISRIRRHEVYDSQ